MLSRSASPSATPSRIDSSAPGCGGSRATDSSDARPRSPKSKQPQGPSTTSRRRGRTRHAPTALLPLARAGRTSEITAPARTTRGAAPAAGLRRQTQQTGHALRRDCPQVASLVRGRWRQANVVSRFGVVTPRSPASSEHRHADGVQSGVQIERNRPTQSNSDALQALNRGGKPGSLRLGAGRSQVQILSPRSDESPQTRAFRLRTAGFRNTRRGNNGENLLHGGPTSWRGPFKGMKRSHGSGHLYVKWGATTAAGAALTAA